MKPQRARDYVILLEDKDFRISKVMLNHIVHLHNKKMHYESIAKEVRRDPAEVLLSLIHVAEEGKKEIESIASTRKLTEELKPRRGEYNVIANVKRVKRNVATVIEIDGYRYVYDPKGR